MVLAVTIATSLTITGGIAGAVVIYKLVINIKTTGAVREGVKVSQLAIECAVYVLTVTDTFHFILLAYSH